MLTYEDFPAGKSINLGPHTVSAQDIIEFAEEFDPQDFHLDANSKQAAGVGGLIASGWHTCSILMRMMCDSFLLETASQGSPGLDEIRWLHPVRPGDVLMGTSEVLNSRLSRSKPTLGLVHLTHTLKNQDDTVVMTVSGINMISTRDGVVS